MNVIAQGAVQLALFLHLTPCAMKKMRGLKNKLRSDVGNLCVPSIPAIENCRAHQR
jgi:hypothetical protein